MKSRILYLLVVLLLTNINALAQMAVGEDHFSRYMFDEIQIIGKTNVNDFHLKYHEHEFCTIENKLQGGHSSLGINIPANQVEAESKMMLNDFLDLVHADKYPTINIEIAHEEIQLSSTEVSSLKNIELSMNGITKQFQCKTYSEPCYANQWCLTGKLEIRLTDFGINPPRKFFGLLKVKDEIFINFRILFS